MQQSIINIRVILRLRLFQQAYRQTDIQIYFFSFTLIIDRNSSFSLEKRANIDTEYLQAYVDIMKIKKPTVSFANKCIFSRKLAEIRQLIHQPVHKQEKYSKASQVIHHTDLKNGNLELIKK